MWSSVGIEADANDAVGGFADDVDDVVGGVG